MSEKKRNIAVGNTQISAVIPDEIVAWLDDIKHRHGYRSRGESVRIILGQAFQDSINNAQAELRAHEAKL